VALKVYLRRLEKAARGQLSSIELEDGSTFYFDQMEARRQVFVHSVDCACAHGGTEWPRPPEILQKIARAKDRRAALEPFLPERGAGQMGAFNVFPYEVGPLLERGEFVRRPLLVDQEPGDGCDVPDLSEQ